MFDLRMFSKGTWGTDFHPELQPDNNIFVLSPHKGLSNFSTGLDDNAVKDATTGGRPENTQAAYTNYGLIANVVTSTGLIYEDIVTTLS